MSSGDLVASSYQHHVDSLRERSVEHCWRQPHSIDAWRHQRMYARLDVVMNCFPQATWLTVGDGGGGQDARYLLDRGSDVLATDIDDALLQQAKEEGRIPKCEAQNLEALDLPDDSFDFVLCKETYHHLPRPMLGLYEMIRVARFGVVLIEPTDPYLYSGAVDAATRWMKDRIKPLRGMAVQRADFEEIGNYVYSLSERELEKVATGVGWSALATTGFNDHFEEGLGGERQSEENPVFRRVHRRIRFQDALCSLGLKKPGYMVAVLLRAPLDPTQTREFRSAGFAIRSIPPHPLARV